MNYDQKFAQDYLNQLMSKHKIFVREYSQNSSGRAWFNSRQIRVPKPTNVDRFGVYLHEIKHIIDGRWGLSYEREFACDMYALSTIKAFGYEHREWEKRCNWHSLQCIAKAFNRGLKISSIPYEIIEYFSEIDFSDWYGKKVYIRYDHSHKTLWGYTIEFKHKLKIQDVENKLKSVGMVLFKSDNYYSVNLPGYGIELFTSLDHIISKFQLT